MPRSRAPLTILLAFAGMALQAQVPAQVIPLTATTTHAPPSITLHWPADPSVKSYSLYYKAPDTGSWMFGLSLPGGTTSFTDNGVALGQVWEYMIVDGASYPYEHSVCVPVGTPVTFSISDALQDGLCCTFGDGSWSIWACSEEQARGAAFSGMDEATFTVCGSSGCSDVAIRIEPDVFVDPIQWELRNAGGQLLASDGDLPAPRFGVITAGVEVPVDESPGRILLVVEQALAAPLAEELLRLHNDLVAEGWQPEVLPVSASMTPQQVKEGILNAHQAAPGLSALLLLGEVPVPYSGMVAPDGHLPDHLGAWPADLYYAELDGPWSDLSVQVTSASNPSNHNVPGDGKFDQSVLPGNVDLLMGRIDLYGLPSFGLSPVELTRRYLDRAHAFRTGDIPYERRAWVDENFPEDELDSPIQRSCIPMFGQALVAAGDFVQVQSAAAPLWTMGGGGGSNTGAQGVATTQQLAGAWLNGVFGHLFGSYFGDWDRSDNLLRATVGAGMLGVVWGGQELNFHDMALNAPIGSAARRSQNASYRTAGRQGRGIHVALQGDPTLRPFPIAPVTGLQASVGQWGMDLDWDVHPLADRGYAIYRKGPGAGVFTRLQGGTAPTNHFFDPAPPTGTSTYMVRPIDLDTSASGTFLRMGPGAIVEAVSTGVEVAVGSPRPLVAPLPEAGQFQVRLVDGSLLRTWSLYDVRGARVPGRMDPYMDGWRLITGAPAGHYTLLMGTTSGPAQVPVIVMR